MIFSEVYGSYFNAAAKILERAVDGQLTESDIVRIVNDSAFGESVLSLPSKIKGTEWGLVTADLKTPLKHKPYKPLTLLEKRWLKTLTSDPKFKLFGVEVKGLDDVEPLYDRGSFVYFDRYCDGDPYESEDYIKNFRVVLEALRNGKKLRIEFFGHKGRKHNKVVSPLRLEYSPQDDKFRLLTVSSGRSWIINMARVQICSVMDESADTNELPLRNTAEVILELKDERNALERAMLHFSYLEKKTEPLDNGRYKVTLRYDRDDETELLIRIIAFGPMVKVLQPESFVRLVKERLTMQKMLNF